MKIIVKRKAILDQIILIIMMLQVMVFRWLGIQDEVDRVLIILIILSFLVHYHAIIKQPVFLWLLLFGVYQIINYLILGGNTRFLLRNGYRITKSVIIIIYFSFLLYYERAVCIKFIKSIFPVLNIYMILNIPVLLLQLGGRYSLAAYYQLGSMSNYYKKDLISGLFGRYGTPCLAFYATFLAIYNYIYGQMWLNKKYRGLFSTYNIILLAFYLWMSTQNDNKGHYIVVVLMITLLILYLEEGRLLNRFGNRHGVFAKAVKRVVLLCVCLGFYWSRYITFSLRFEKMSQTCCLKR